MSQLAKNTAYLTAASIGQKIVAFFYFAVIARMVGVEFTGKYFLALSLTTMVGVIADFGLTSVLIRDIAKRPDEQEGLLAHVIGLKLGLSLLAVAIVVALSFALGYDELTRTLMYTASLVMVLDTFHLTFYGVFRGHHRLGTESIGIFIGQLVTLLIGVVSLIISPNLLFLIVALIGGSLWNVLFAATRLSRMGIHPFRLSFSRQKAKRLLRVALPFALAAIFVKVYSTADSILLERFLGDEGVGLYSIAYKLTYAFQFLPMAFVAALYPTLSTLVHKKDTEQLTSVFHSALWYMSLLAVPVVFGIATTADLIVPLVYGSAYFGSILPLQLLVFVLLFIFLDFPIGSLLNADDRQGTKTLIMFWTMIINVVANIVLIPRLGILGASTAALLSFAFMFIVGLFAVRKTLRLEARSILARIGPVLLSGLCMATVVLSTKPVLGILTIPLGGAVYVTCLFLFRSVSLESFRNVKRGMIV
ncbi:hypothetical protein COV06_00960 [Candidatus Uhrbacteria bacterium CG10_big_fil_rev_8_21_14_0_10_50_16]|uniref:Uncharacterized protein n=1 Tax=Candidatus Uhrbacteria bacterium CG10_big_fil_rev_8_21_14_0_10_50_16 TaxID=1975039 RepID=A0A2H0RQC5_9BACT|nr:MAG: hypothetical protein COV06_00960 [Candidatus Uhrbacteria bacterium CG10_big_fil_rev_8_21_14_0_10_50_16]